ncbi:hypothetical protein QJQ45_003812 [Haematococcus lacustris]|nr:hypothetical protein QJQ45_003812 [Haematococcus lacustris]
MLLATWDAVWEVYLDPKWARQRLRLYGAQDRALEQFFKTLEEEMSELSTPSGLQRLVCQLQGFADRKHLTVNVGKSKLEEEMSELSTKRHGRAKQLVVFFGTAGIGTGEGWGATAVLRACCKVVCEPRSACQHRVRVVLVDEHRTTRRIGESRWRPLELCFWPDQGALPAKGKEYPGLGYKRQRDKPPKAQQQQQPAEAQ